MKCINCKYCWYDDRSPLMCSNKEARHLGLVAVNGHFIAYCDTIRRRQNGKCKYYKRKWWKFWVK